MIAGAAECRVQLGAGELGGLGSGQVWHPHWDCHGWHVHLHHGCRGPDTQGGLTGCAGKGSWLKALKA